MVLASVNCVGPQFSVGLSGAHSHFDKTSGEFEAVDNKNETTINSDMTRNVSMGHGCPRYCQIRINRALSLTKGHNSDNNRWILSVIKLDLYFMTIYLCMK